MLYTLTVRTVSKRILFKYILAGFYKGAVKVELPYNLSQAQRTIYWFYVGENPKKIYNL